MLRNTFFPLCVSLGIHIALALLLFLGISLPENQTRIKPKLEYINATLVTMEKAKKKAPEPKKQQAKPKPKPPKPKPKPPEPKPPEPKPEPKKEEPKKDAPKKETEKKEVAPEPPVKEKPKVLKKSLDEQKRADLLKQQSDEFEAVLDEEFIDDPAWDEEADNEEMSDEERLVLNLGTAIQRAIIARWSRPPSARNGMRVDLIINLLPTGDIVGVQVAKSSGNRAFDRSAETAVNKATRFPEVQELRGNMVFERNFRQFRLTFRPEDLRK